MGFDAWLTLGLTGLIFLVLIRDAAPPDIVFLGAMTVLLLFGVIDTTTAFAGFANPGVITIAMLFIVTAALQETGLMEAAGQRLLGRTKTETGALSRLSGVVLPLSAFLNNTPVVAMFMPLAVTWGRRNRISPSRLLMPVAFLATLGGTCTLIGTSTNLVVDGMMKARDIAGLTGRPGIGLFELSLVGVPAAIVGAIYLMTLGRALLPDRKELLEQLGEQRREYLAEMLVRPGCRLIGQSVEAAGLRSLPGLFLIEIEREEATIAPVGPDDVFEANDRLIFTGVVSSIVELEQVPGLVPAADPSYEITPAKQRGRLLCEAVISSRSQLVGKTIREADFRAAYGAAVVAVCRDGHRIPRKLGDVRLRPGDTLLLQTRPHFPRAHRNDPGFYLVSDIPDWRPLRRDRLWIALALFAALLVLMTTGWVDEPVAAAACAVAMIAAGCVSAGDARQSIDWSTLVTIAAAFAVGKALDESGAAAGVTGAVFSLVGDDLSAWGALAIIYFVTWIVTEMLTNNAAAVLMFPFALETAERFGVSPLPFLIALTLGASNGFATPIGYQTYMMVYGPGGYKFSDFIRVGLPLSLILGTVATLLIPFWWPFTPVAG
ncbi:MAG: SLC13 family permease [Planctomycetaceae bacterium]